MPKLDYLIKLKSKVQQSKMVKVISLSIACVFTITLLVSFSGKVKEKVEESAYSSIVPHVPVNIIYHSVNKSIYVLILHSR